MFFSVKKWIDRFSEYPNRRQLTKADGTTEQVTVTRDEGTVFKEGDKFKASTMNDLENRISSFDSMVSNQFGITDDASTASAAYTEGSFIIHNGVRYRVTAAIAKGDAFKEGTNISKATVNDQIANMNTQINSLNDNLAKISMDAVKISARNDTSDSIKFGVDSSGNYGYIKAGADTVTPFKSQADVDVAYAHGKAINRVVASNISGSHTLDISGFNDKSADAFVISLPQSSNGSWTLIDWGGQHTSNVYINISKSVSGNTLTTNVIAGLNGNRVPFSYSPVYNVYYIGKI